MFGKRAAFAVATIVAMCTVSFVSVTAQVRILFPYPNQSFYPDRVVRIEWQSGEAHDVDLMYSQDQGTSWKYMATGVNENGYDWRLPLLDTQNVLFKVQVANLEQPQELLQFRHREGVLSSCFNQTGEYILSSLENRIIELRTTDDLLSMATTSLSGVKGGAACLYASHPDTAISFIDREIILVNNSAFTEPIRFGSEIHSACISAIASHPTEAVCATACADGTVRIWSLTDRTVIRTITTTLRTDIHALCFSPDGTKILYAGEEGIIYVEDWKTAGGYVSELRGHGDGTNSMSVLCAQFSPDGKYIVSGGVDFTIRLWDLQFEHNKYIMFGHGAAVTSLQFSSDGTRLLSGSADSTVRQWSVASGRELHHFLALKDEVSSVDYSPGGDSLLASERHTGTLVLWKNVRVIGSSDSVSGFVTYPVSLRIASISSIVGTRTDIPVLFDQVVSVPFFQRSRFNATILLTIPRQIIEVDDTKDEYEIRHGDELDTLSLPIVFSSNDTVARIPVRFLLSDNASANVEILQGPRAIQWTNSVRAFTLDHTVSGVVTSDKSCPDQGRGGLHFSAETTSTLWPQPSDTHATLRFSAYEEGEYRFEIVNEIGMIVQELPSQRFLRGEQTILLESDTFHSAVYQIRIIGPSSVRGIPFIVQH